MYPTGTSAMVMYVDLESAVGSVSQRTFVVSCSVYSTSTHDMVMISNASKASKASIQAANWVFCP